jgi:hypothetical protein
VRVRLAAVFVLAAAEGFGLRQELNVDFEPDDGHVFGENFGRETGYGWHRDSLAIENWPPVSKNAMDGCRTLAAKDFPCNGIRLMAL